MFSKEADILLAVIFVVAAALMLLIHVLCLVP